MSKHPRRESPAKAARAQAEARKAKAARAQAEAEQAQADLAEAKVKVAKEQDAAIASRLRFHDLQKFGFTEGYAAAGPGWMPRWRNRVAMSVRRCS